LPEINKEKRKKEGPLIWTCTFSGFVIYSDVSWFSCAVFFKYLYVYVLLFSSIDVYCMCI
jgi:hypothetical protein